MKYCNVYDTNKWFQSDNVAVGLNVMDLDWIVSKWDFGETHERRFHFIPDVVLHFVCDHQINGGG